MNLCAQLHYIIKYLDCFFCFIPTVGHITMHEESHSSFQQRNLYVNFEGRYLLALRFKFK